MKQLKKAQRKDSFMKNANKEQGITLIALVVTIAILLILAAVTIQFTLGDNGLVQQAKDAANEQKNAIVKDETLLNGLQNELQAIRDEVNSGSTAEQEENRIAVSNVTKQTYNQYAQDIYENPITIPAGFHIVAHGTNNISYTYAGDTNHTPTVQDGIVIADDEGNQFTWVPVGTINNKTGDTRGTTTTINLARIEWNETTGEPGENKQEITTVAQARAVTNANAVELKASTTDTGTRRFKELVSKSSGEGTAALNLNAFLESAIENHGYYMARFEAGVTNYDSTKTATSQSGTAVDSWTGYQSETGKTLQVVSKQGEQGWNHITQSKAAEVAQGMYATNNNYVSDLVNSFAWDTAIVFIDTYGYTPDSDDGKYDDGKYAAVHSRLYAAETGPSSEGSYGDNYCNIYDMAGNYVEWTTEYSTNPGYPCGIRGGDYNNAVRNYTAYRGNHSSNDYWPDVGFRSLLYVVLNAAE